MKDKIFQFGEKVKGYSINVLNEREIRATSGILLIFALIGFFKAISFGNFNFIKTFSVIFLIDFIIRLFINPKYSPSLIIGRFFVRNQTPEYVGAHQKKFAWIIGLILVSTIVIQLVIFNLVSPITFLFCLFCLIFLFFESAFGICIGCKIYALFPKNKLELCPGGVCDEKKRKEKIQTINFKQTIIVFLFLILIFGIVSSGIIYSESPSAVFKAKFVNSTSNNNYFSENINSSQNNINSSNCLVPKWAKDIGHEEIYKEHHGCELFN